MSSRFRFRRHVAELAARDPRDHPQVKNWCAAGRVTILVLLGYSALQYYFLDVCLTIMVMPSVALIAV